MRDTANLWFIAQLVVFGTTSAESILDSTFTTAPTGIYGHPLCPCVEETGDNSLYQSSFGIGCRPHDSLDTDTDAKCDGSSCNRAWCYVDHNQCHVKHSVSQLDKRKWYRCVRYI